MRLVPAFVRLLLAALLGVAALWPAAAGAGHVRPPTPPLLLTESAQQVAAWSHVRVRTDPDGHLTADAAWHSLDAFTAPDTPRDNLGAAGREPTWVHVPLALDTQAPSEWWLHLDYPVMHEVDVTVLDEEGRHIHEARLGSRQVFVAREQATRALSVRLRLAPGHRYDVLLRIATDTALIVPITFMQAPALARAESTEQIVQGLFAGLALCMLAYSLLQWVSLRQSMFLHYAAAVIGGQLYLTAYFGTGAQYFWQDNAWLPSHMSALSPLLMTAANAQFLKLVLDLRRHARRIARALDWISLVCLIVGAGFAADGVSYRSAAVVAMVMSIGHLALVIPLGVRQARQGDRGASLLVVGWVPYVAGIVTTVALLRGHLPVTFWTQHAYQLGSMIEMMSWMLVLGVRVEQTRMAADRAQREHDWLHTLAHTDSLTGLPNRRGLEAALGRTLRGPSAPRYTAVYLLDLDGFKPVNDELGHEAGDELLKQVSDRLRQAVRGTDVVARLGGDEFVVVAGGLTGAEMAEPIGEKLLAAFEQPFPVAGQRRAVGATIGYAVHPEDTDGVTDTASLLRRADSAMYRGKLEGKRCLRRARSGDSALAPMDPHSPRPSAVA